MQQGFIASEEGRIVKVISFFFNGKQVVFRAIVQLTEIQNEARTRLYLNEKEIEYDEAMLLKLLATGHYGGVIMQALLNFERYS